MVKKKSTKKTVTKVAESSSKKKATKNENMFIGCSKKLQPCAPVLIRIVAGLIFFFQGASKLGWIGGGSLEGTAGFFSSLGIPLAAFFAALVAIIEFFGGIALILGVAPRVTSSLLAIILIVALFTAHWNWSEGFLAFWAGAKYVLFLIVGLISIKAYGAGKYSLWNNW